MSDVRAESTRAVPRVDVQVAPRFTQVSSAANQTCVSTLGFHVAVGVSWLSGVTGVGLIYKAADSELMFLSGLSLLIFGAALSATARVVLSYAIARALQRLGMGQRRAAARAEQLASELLPLSPFPPGEG